MLHCSKYSKTWEITFCKL